MSALAFLFAAVTLAAAEDPLHLPVGDPARKEKEAPLILDAITETSGGSALTPAELPARLAGVQILLVGERHTGMSSHSIERRVLEELLRAGRRVLVGLEMYPYTEQASLDLWVGGKLSEKEFLEQSHWYGNWGYNWNYYRDIFLLAGEAQMPMFAINTPREVIAAVRKKGFTGLTEEEAARIPTRIDTDSPEGLRLFRAALSEEGFHSGMSEQDWKAMFDAQCAWDATFAQNSVAAIRKSENDPKAILVVLVGAGHVAYGLGIERQAGHAFSGKIASLIPVAVEDEKGKRVGSVRASYADFVWGVPAEKDPLYPSLGVSTASAEAEKPPKVIYVEKGSVAERAGIAVGDVLVSMDGSPVGDRETLNRLVARARWGDTMRLSLRRGGSLLNVTAFFRRESPQESHKD
ncbi:MAG TPA: ChaN family lipoprotein [Thermoanaerobaculia bacterium]|nr:ChaN family lipoprotein [Thermoanaerobaculia bacterium]